MEALSSLILILSTAGVLTLQSCNRRSFPDIPVTKDVSFETHIKPITSTVCIKCHSQGSKDFSQYKNAYGNRFAINQRVVVDRTMPLGVFLDDKDRALFRDWFNQGGKR